MLGHTKRQALTAMSGRRESRITENDEEGVLALGGYGRG